MRARVIGIFAVLVLACDSPAPTSDAGASATAPTAVATTKKKKPPPKPTPKIEVPEDLNKPPATATRTPSGLVTRVLKGGDGTSKPGPESKVKVHYSGWKTDGKMFGSTVASGKPADWNVKDLPSGWAEAVQMMVTGEKRRLWVPSKLAYGDSPRMIGAPAGDLVLDVELVKLTGDTKPLPAPTDVAAAPADAKKTASGLAYKLLEAGKGDRQPTTSDKVQVHYTGWTTDGKMFDSSVTKGRPASFQVTGVIKGWTEGLQLMKEGDKMRFWIPADLAYGDKPKGSSPAGKLVFDVELIKIQ